MRHLISAVVGCFVGCFVVCATTLAFPCDALSSSLVVDSTLDKVEVPFVCPNCSDQDEAVALASDTREFRLMDPRGTTCVPGGSVADGNLADGTMCRSVAEPTATLKASLHNIMRI